MPFKSEKQRRYLWANEPEIARDWSDKYGSRVKRANGGTGNFFQKHAPATMNLMQNIPVDKWVDQQELIDLESQYGFGSAGLPSIARHTAGMSNLSDTFSSALGGKFQTTPDRVSQFLGDVGAFGLGALNEIPGVYRSITGDTPISETWEDLKANALGTFGTPYGVPSEQIWKDVYADKYADRFYDDEKGTIAFDPNNPQVNRSMFFNPYSALGIGALKGGVALKNYLRNMFISKVAGKSISKYTKPFLKRQMMKFAGVDPRARVAFKHKDQGYQYDPTLRTVFKEEIGGAESKIKPPTRKTYVSPARPHGGGGGGGQPGSMPTGTAGQNPWGRAKGGLAGLWQR